MGKARYPFTTNNEAGEASAEHVAALARIWRPGPQPRPCSSTVASTEPTSSGARTREVILMVPPLGGRDVSPWVRATVKTLEQGRDAGAVTATGRATVAAYPAEWVLGKQRLRLPVRAPTHEALS